MKKIIRGLKKLLQSVFTKNTMLNFIAQIIPVMIGVYLGLIGNNWNEAQQQKRQQTKIIKNIQNELEQNKMELERTLSYHKTLSDSASYYIHSKKVFKQFSFWKGLNTVSLKSSAYQTAIISGVLPDLEVEKLNLINEVYTSQEDLIDQSKVYFESMTNKIGQAEYIDNKTYFLHFIFNFAYDQVVSESFLLEQYDQLIEVLNK